MPHRPAPRCPLMCGTRYDHAPNRNCPGTVPRGMAQFGGGGQTTMDVVGNTVFQARRYGMTEFLEFSIGCFVVAVAIYIVALARVLSGGWGWNY